MSNKPLGGPKAGARQRLPLGLRTDLILLGEAGVFTRFETGLAIRTPDNPHFWWGNYLFFDMPPQLGDRTRWEDAFERYVRTPQPASRHTTFAWAGEDQGVVQPFLEQGYQAQRAIVLSTMAPLAYPFADPSLQVRVLAGSDWPALEALMLAHRGAEHPAEPYAHFVRGRITQWRSLVQASLGDWFGGFIDGTLVCSAGVFVEAPVPTDAHCGTGWGAERLARFQEVLTDARHRRRGLAGTLLFAACGSMRRRHGPLRFVIVADADQAAQRIYKTLGFRVVETSQSLEKGGY